MIASFVVLTLIFIINILLMVAIVTYLERKVLGAMQRREGPNVVGFLGLLQPIADAVKLLVKETILPRMSNKFLFFFAPFLILFVSLFIWIFIPIQLKGSICNFEMNLLFIFFLSSLNVFSIFIAGWTTNSKFAMLGSIRGISQMISYEIIIMLSILPLVLITSSISLENIAIFQSNNGWAILFTWPSALIFLIAIFAETNRAPFDLPEAEAELVAGYNVDYSSFSFASFFLGEYSNMVTMMSLFVSLFMGGAHLINSSYFLNNFIIENFISTTSVTSWLVIFCSILIFFVKVGFMLFVMIWVRSSWPRLRYDQLLTLCWKIMFPLVFTWFLFFVTYLFFIKLFFI